MEQSPFGGFLFWGGLCEGRIYGKGGQGDSKKLALENATILLDMFLVGVRAVVEVELNVFIF